MNSLLKIVNDKYFVKLGDCSFSPIMEATAGLTLEYCKLFGEKESCLNPFFICYPQKKDAYIWTSILILANYYYEDHFKNVLEGIDFNTGDKIKVFNTIAKIQRIVGDKIIIKFNDQEGFGISNKLRPQLSKVDQNRRLNNFDLYRRNAAKIRSERNAISKILHPNEHTIIINTSNLESKVLLIPGRGNTKETRRLLSKINIYNEPLSKIYSNTTQKIKQATLLNG